jgi:hypothetical protein
MENPKLIYKSPIYLSSTVIFILFFAFLCGIIIAMIIDSDLVFKALNITVTILLYLLLVSKLLADSLSIVFIYEDRIEIKHLLYLKKYRYRIFYNNEIKQVRLVPVSRGVDAPSFHIITSKKGLIKIRKNVCYAKKFEDKKKVINHFYNLDIPIKIYSLAEENQHLIEK